jgi:hypothetical protein
MLVNQGSIRERPEVLSWLGLRRVRRKEQQVHVVGHLGAHTGLPAGAVEHEDDLLGGTGLHLTRELRQLHCKHRNADGGGQMKDGPPRRPDGQSQPNSATRSDAARWLWDAGPAAPTRAAAAA